MDAEAYAICKNNKCKRDVYTASQIDESFYDKTTADNTFYSKTDANKNFYTKTQIDDKFITKAAAATDITNAKNTLMLPVNSILMFHAGDTVKLPTYGVWTPQTSVWLPIMSNGSVVAYYEVRVYKRTS